VLGESVPKRFQPEFSEDYKEWLTKNPAETIEPCPNVPHHVKDVGAKYQV